MNDVPVRPQGHSDVPLRSDHRDTL
jgi:hypothetical protein